MSLILQYATSDSWNGTHCALDDSACEDNTYLSNGKCISDTSVADNCGDGTYSTGYTCIPDPNQICGQHTQSTAGTGSQGDCKISSSVCGEGTHREGNECVKDTISCEYHTTQIGNECIIDFSGLDINTLQHYYGDSC